jgi:L-rhamnose mutarotase
MLEERAMKRVAFLLKVKADKIAEYRAHHEQVWPEMLAALRRTGWHNYSLFLRPDGLLFGYFEAAESFEASLDGMAREAINAQWQAFMAPYFEGLEGMPADQGMQALDEVFHLD